jgi:hypothetical protein
VKLPITPRRSRSCARWHPSRWSTSRPSGPRADENGEPLYDIQLLAMGEDSADLIPVKVPFDSSQPEGAITH